MRIILFFALNCFSSPLLLHLSSSAEQHVWDKRQNICGDGKDERRHAGNDSQPSLLSSLFYSKIWMQKLTEIGDERTHFFRRRAVWMSIAQNFWSSKFWALFDICIPEGLPTAIWSQVCVNLGLREFSRGPRARFWI